MVLEHAVLDVITGQEPEFERAFQQASGIIAAMAGFRSLRLERAVESPSRYLLLWNGTAWKITPSGFGARPNIRSGVGCCTTSTSRFPPSSTTRVS